MVPKEIKATLVAEVLADRELDARMIVHAPVLVLLAARDELRRQVRKEPVVELLLD